MRIANFKEGRMILDFSDCKSVEDVNKKWLEYAKEMPQYKEILKRFEELKQPQTKKEKKK